MANEWSSTAIYCHFHVKRVCFPPGDRNISHVISMNENEKCRSSLKVIFTTQMQKMHYICWKNMYFTNILYC